MKVGENVVMAGCLLLWAALLVYHLHDEGLAAGRILLVFAFMAGALAAIVGVVTVVVLAICVLPFRVSDEAEPTKHNDPDSAA